MTPDGIPIGRLFGIEIRISLLWSVLIAIITLLGAEQATVAAPGCRSRSSGWSAA